MFGEPRQALVRRVRGRGLGPCVVRWCRRRGDLAQLVVEALSRECPRYRGTQRGGRFFPDVDVTSQSTTGGSVDLRDLGDVGRREALSG